MTISAEEIADNFNGDDDSLRSSIKALIELDNAKAVSSPIGGHAKSLLSAAYHRLASLADMKAEMERLMVLTGEYSVALDDARIAFEEKNTRIAALEAQLAEAVSALEPFAKEESTWTISVADDYRPGIVEPNQRTAHAKAEFSIGDLRRASAIRAEQEGK